MWSECSMYDDDATEPISRKYNKFLFLFLSDFELVLLSQPNHNETNKQKR